MAMKQASWARQLIDPLDDKIEWNVVRKNHTRFVTSRAARMASKREHDRALHLVEQVVKKKRKLGEVLAAVEKKQGSTARSKPTQSKKQQKTQAGGQSVPKAPAGSLAVQMNPTLICALFGSESMAANDPDAVHGIAAHMLQTMSESGFSYETVSRVCRSIQTSDAAAGERLLLSFIACLVCPITTLSLPTSNPYMTLVNIPRPIPSKHKAGGVEAVASSVGDSRMLFEERAASSGSEAEEASDGEEEEE